MLSPGLPFPTFNLPDQDGQLVSDAALRGHKTVVYFYPKDDTSGCTAEACAFRDALPEFGAARVIGVSPDSIKSHKRFVDKYSLNFTLLADEEQTLCQAAGVWVEKSMYGKKYMGVERTTVLVDADGIIERVWPKVKVPGHAEEVRQALQG